MAQVISTLVTDVTAPINFVYMKGLLKAARKTLPYYNGTVPGTLEKNQGSASVKWRRIENLAVATTALGEVTGNAAFGNGRDAVKASITDVTVAIAKYGNAIITTEEIDFFNINTTSAAFVDTLGANAGESLNTLMRDVFDAATTIRYSGGVASDAVVITAMSLNDIKYSVNQLSRQSAMKFLPELNGSVNIGTSPVRQSYIGICHVDVEEDVRDISGFVGVETYGGYTQTMPGEFGHVGGVRWVSTEIAPISTSAGTTTATGMRGASDILNDVYSSFIYGKEAVGSIGLGENFPKEVMTMADRIQPVSIIQKKPGSSGVADMFDEIGSVAWKAWFAGKILNANWIVKIRTLASDLA